MFNKIFNDHTPGWIAKSLVIVITSFWFYWSIAEMYHEGWWGPFYIRLIYLIPGVMFLALTLVAIKWPKIGGWLIIIIGGAFTFFFMDISIVDGKLSIGRDFAGLMITGPLVFLGILFLFEGRNHKHRIENGWTTHSIWWRRNFWFITALLPQILITIGLSTYYLPFVLTRENDGDFGARLIEGNDITLIWAPEGPGWNWKQDFGGYPSWNRIALYGLEPIGFEDKAGFERGSGNFASAKEMERYNLCLYLSEDGYSLMDEPQYIWRMPTIDDYVRSFARHGENAGCVWRGEKNDQADCTFMPDKETPLWNPELEPIYYWAAEEYNERDGYFVSYNGWVQATYKPGGNPRHSYRCVREP